jgi:hypothetical protein
MSVRNRRIGAYGAALAVVGGLVALAGAVGYGSQLRIVCPTEVWAGNPIDGYITGNEGLTVGHGSDMGQLAGSPVMGFTDPLWFSYGTTEPMSGTVATVQASDSDESVVVSVIVK